MTVDVWLPIPPEEIEGLPEGPDYLFWDGGEDGDQEFPGDPADCVLYVVPYMKRQPVKTRPLERMRNLQVIQTLTAGIDDMTASLSSIAPGVRLCNARGVHEASTAELALTLTLACCAASRGSCGRSNRSAGRGTSTPRWPTGPC